ncbi:MAG TPA: S53 family peptidase [Mycobacterium sp.]|nr:S53 family peptidase [Mycobacterium sp.]
MLALAGVLLFTVSDLRPWPAPDQSSVVGGPLALLLASSTDLGPTRTDQVQLTVALHDTRRPAALMAWAADNGLSIRWRPGDNWAIIEGAPTDVAATFEVPVHDYQGRRGQLFYASALQPSIPAPLLGEVSGIGRILGYTPHHMARPVIPLTETLKQGLTPNELLTAYNANGLAAQGFTGRGATIVFFEFDGFAQDDLDSFAELSGLPTFTPVVIGGQPGAATGETTMDLEVAHAIAPDAQLVVINAVPTLQGDGNYEKIARMFEEADSRFPGAVWSLSIGWACDRLLTAADLAPARAALSKAQSHGTSAFAASGDNGGLQCKGGADWSSPPGPNDVGLDAISSLPEMTAVGGTALSLDENGAWLSEQAWFNSPLTIGSSGGVSALFPRPQWQQGISSDRDSTHRLSPDIAAAADPFTGVRIVFNQQVLVGGGTSQAAPIWAGLAAVMNQYLTAHGGSPLGAANPLLYRIASGASRPAFRDVSLGANAVDRASPGYDLITGLGSPNVDNLVRNLLDIEGASR